jgi:hypothetical protein
MEVINLGGLEEIKLNLDPPANSSSLPGAELLMNYGKKDTNTNTIQLSDIDKLEQELNSLSEVKLETPSSHTPSASFDFPKIIEKPNVQFDLPEPIKLEEPKKSVWDFKPFQGDPDKVKAPDQGDLLREKFTILRKLEDLESKGVRLSRKYHIDSPLDEMKGEYEHIVSEKEKSNNVKFQGKMLMACVTGLEFLNSKFDPFDIKLDGWSEQVNENISDYDEIFAELHEKYRSKAKLAPEIKLLFQLGGGAIMLHMTNTMFKSSMPGMDDIMRQNPELMQKFTQAAMSSMSSTNPGFSNFMNTVNQNPVRQPEKRPEMKGPSDINDILSGIKSKTIDLEKEDAGSTVSMRELKEMKESLMMPNKSKKRASAKNTVSLDI